MFANFRLKIRLFWVSDKKTAINSYFRIPQNKTSHLVKPISIKPLIYVKAIYGQKTWKKSIFHSLPLAQYSIFLDYRVALKLGNQLRFCELEM